MPAVKTASMYRAVYFLSDFIGRGPMSASLRAYQIRNHAKSHSGLLSRHWSMTEMVLLDKPIRLWTAVYNATA